MSILDFIESVWANNEEELRKIQELERILDELRSQRTEVHFVSVQSNP